jgi:hypothetical protein
MKSGKISWCDAGKLNTEEETRCKIDFTNVSLLREFINNGDRIFKTNNPPAYKRLRPSEELIFVRVVKILKIKNTSIDAVVQKTTLRECNLDLLLEL